MVEMIEARKELGGSEQRYDLFSSLLDANDDSSDGLAKLTQGELLGTEHSV